MMDGANERGNGRVHVLIGGVGYRWQGDGSFGLVLGDELAKQDWPSGVEVMDLGYGAIYASQDIAALQPDRLILLAAVERGREPGSIHHYQWAKKAVAPEEIQARIYEAGAGVIDLDHLLIIAQHFDALPDDVTVMELEPFSLDEGARLSEHAARLLPQLVDYVREEALLVAAQGARRTNRSMLHD